MYILLVIWVIAFLYIKNKRMRENRENPYGQRNTDRSSRAGIPSAGSPVKTSSQQKSTQRAIKEAKEDGHSTTAYLMERAEADAREHEREKYEEQMRLYETRGGLVVAERFLDGDSVPQGKRCVSCGYCGAENLVPVAVKTRYSCYFCREPLN